MMFSNKFKTFLDDLGSETDSNNVYEQYLYEIEEFIIEGVLDHVICDDSEMEKALKEIESFDYDEFANNTDNPPCLIRLRSAFRGNYETIDTLKLLLCTYYRVERGIDFGDYTISDYKELIYR